MEEPNLNELLDAIDESVNIQQTGKVNKYIVNNKTMNGNIF